MFKQRLVSIGATLSVLIATTAPLANAAQEQTLREFLGKRYIHGLPIAQAKSYPTESLSELVILLKDPEFEPYRCNIVLMMGLLGDPAAVPTLIHFLEKTQGEVSEGTFLGLLTVSGALGILANAGDKAGLDYVVTASDPEFWTNRRLGWSYSKLSAKERGAILTTKAITGLAYAGNGPAKQRLTELAADASIRVKAAAESALELHAKIAELGLDKVFEDQK